jgi:hypothetical protein
LPLDSSVATGESLRSGGRTGRTTNHLARVYSLKDAYFCMAMFLECFEAATLRASSPPITIAIANRSPGTLLRCCVCHLSLPGCMRPQRRPPAGGRFDSLLAAPAQQLCRTGEWTKAILNHGRAPTSPALWCPGVRPSLLDAPLASTRQAHSRCHLLAHASPAAVIPSSVAACSPILALGARQETRVEPGGLVQRVHGPTTWLSVDPPRVRHSVLC